MSSERPSIDEYFMRMAELVSTRATCLRRAVGAVIVMEKRVLSTGYNGAPRGMRHCAETGCLREQLKVPPGERHELCRGVHAEQNAIIQAALFGVSIRGSKMYVTDHPCSVCAKMIVNAGIEEVIYKEGYPDELSLQVLSEGGVRTRQYR
ncbi:MAG: cytidine/deoxycytidylate deaminase family protein [Candidatus Thermoplasmatota archaeon]